MLGQYLSIQQPQVSEGLEGSSSAQRCSPILARAGPRPWPGGRGCLARVRSQYMKSAGREGGQMRDVPRGREPRRRALSRELPRESGLGIYEFLVPIKKDSRPQVLWRGSLRAAKTSGGREAGFLERYHPLPSEGRFRAPRLPHPRLGLRTSL